jgi:murein L,D-transpeptidase YcbB/YkuD
MHKKISMFLILLSAVLLLHGCATGRAKSDLENQGLKNQIQALEAQIQEKDAQINALNASLDKSGEERVSGYRKSQKMEVKSRPNTKQIQAALKNAGYNPGSVDGRMGKQTRDAIRAFQKANNLRADGRVGTQTWRVLRKYLEEKVK